MMKKLKFNTFSIALLLFLFSHSKAFSQNDEYKWVLGASLNAVDFFPTSQPATVTGNDNGFFNEITNANKHWNISAPKINITRHLKNRFSVDLALSYNRISKIGDFEIENVSYQAADLSLQYALVDNYKKLVPYAFVGVGLTGLDWHGAGTVSVGLGATYWFTETVGANISTLYKHNGDKWDLLPHFQHSAGIFIRFGGRGGSSGDCY